MSWAEFHSRSEELASRAEMALRSGEGERALEFYRLAAEEESRALEALPSTKEKTLGITIISAISLWYKAHDFANASKLAHQWLAGNLLPRFAVHQLQQLLQFIWTAEAAENAGISFVPGDVLVAVRGGEVVHGGAPLDLILHKIDEIQAIVFRTIEMLLDKPLRKRGGPPAELQELFRPWLFQAPSGSYQFAVRVQAPRQRELFQDMNPRVEMVTSSFFAILGATSVDPVNDLPEVVPNPEYRGAFLKLCRNLAPTGKRFAEVEIRDASLPASAAISLNQSSREAIRAALRNERSQAQVDEDGALQRFTGKLRAVHLDKDWLEIATDDPSCQHRIIYDLNEALDDVVGQMVNRRVVVTAALRARDKWSFRDIELEE